MWADGGGWKGVGMPVQTVDGFLDAATGLGKVCQELTTPFHGNALDQNGVNIIRGCMEHDCGHGVEDRHHVG